MSWAQTDVKTDKGKTNYAAAREVTNHVMQYIEIEMLLKINKRKFLIRFFAH